MSERASERLQTYRNTLITQWSDNDNRKPGNLNSSSAFHKGLLVDD